MFHVGCSCDRVHRRFLGFGDFPDLPLHGFFVKLIQIHHVSFIFFTNVMTFLKSCNHSSSFLHKNDVYVRQGDSQKRRYVYLLSGAIFCYIAMPQFFRPDVAIFSSGGNKIYYPTGCTSGKTPIYIQQTIVFCTRKRCFSWRKSYYLLSESEKKC